MHLVVKYGNFPTFQMDLHHKHVDVATTFFWSTLYFKVSLLQCDYTFKYRVIFISYMYLILYGKG